MDVNDEGVHLEKHTECDARQHVVVHGPDCVLCHRASVETTMSDRKSSMREKDPTHGAASRSQCCKGSRLIVKHCEDGAVVVDGRSSASFAWLRSTRAGVRDALKQDLGLALYWQLTGAGQIRHVVCQRWILHSRRCGTWSYSDFGE